MKVNFWFDPTCPWCYVTSRWYAKVSDELNIPTTWEIFSLSIKNSAQNLSDEMKAKHYRSLRVIRIIQAVKNNLTNEHVYNLYASIGKQFHSDKLPIDHNLETILDNCDIDKSFMKYMDDDSLDIEIKLSTDNAVKVCGNDVGVPIILLDNGTKQKAMFGPVISEIPNLNDSLEMWEHFKYICFNENISELKRHRTIPYNPVEL
jgi:hypothetical protein